MPSPPPPAVSILTAERAGGSRPSEDRIFATDQAVVVLDGASQPDPTPKDGGWLANELGTDLVQRLREQPREDLRRALENSIRSVADRHHLRRGESPSTTVAIVRWNVQVVDVLVLCDSTVAVLDRSGRTHEVRDDRLAVVSRELRRPPGIAAEDLDGWRVVVSGQRRLRNTSGGYWVAEAVPEAARHAVTARWPIDQVAVVMAMTDGISIGIDRYKTPADWAAAFELASDDPHRLVDVVHQAETTDLHGQRWPRWKPHDDKAVAVLRFDLVPSRRTAP